MNQPTATEPAPRTAVVATDDAAGDQVVLRPEDGRHVEWIDHDTLAQRLDWGLEFFGADRHQVTEHPGADLLNAYRFDLLAKVIYAEQIARGIQDDFGERAYAEHIRVWNGFVEAKPAKTSREEFVASFRELVESARAEGLNPARSLVPVSRHGRIFDGAHRIAAAVALRTPVRVVWSETAAYERLIPQYNYRYFAERGKFVPTGLSQYFSDEMALSYCRHRPTARIVVLFPAADRRHDDAVIDLLREVGTVVYQKSFVLTPAGALQFIRHLYHHDPRGWMGTVRDGFAGARDKAKRCFPVVRNTRVLLFEPLPGADLVALKNRIRDIHGIGNDSIHITDEAKELPFVGGFAFNRNSIEFFNGYRPRLLERFEKLFASYREAVSASGVSPHDIAVHGSACLAAAGIRDCADIDFVGIDDTSRVLERPGISQRGTDEFLSRADMHAAICDPANHFWYWGQKFITLRTLRAYKAARAEVPKDIRDLALIDRYARPSRWHHLLAPYYALRELGHRSPRALARALLHRLGLLTLVRRVRR